MQKIQISFRTYSVEDIKRLIDNEEFIIQPKFQRRRTSWPITAKTGLLDSMMNNFPIPPIYAREYVSDNRERKREIIDGQQRVSTILEFIKGQWKLSKNLINNEFIGYNFNELPFETQQQILDYELSFLSIKGATDSDIIAIFSRINSFSLPLNKQEKRNATYTGQFKTLVYELSSRYYTFWTENKIFNNAQIARMGDAELTSELITIMDGGLDGFTAKKVEENYKSKEINFPEKEKLEKVFNNIMTFIGTCYEDIEIRKQFGKKSMFFSLFVAFFDKMYSLNKGVKHAPKSINIKATKVNLKQFAIRYSNPKFDKGIRLLFNQGTGETSNRIKRHKIIVELIS